MIRYDKFMSDKMQDIKVELWTKQHGSLLKTL